MMRLIRSRILLAALAAALAGPAQAADPVKEKELPQVPGDDIFGFTSATDIGNTGDTGFANENDGRVSKRDGRYFALNQKFEFSRTLTPSWWIAGSFFTAHNYSSNVAGINDINRYQFDGLSMEIAHKLIDRSETNPFAVTLSLEPRWGRIDGASGVVANSYGATFKIFTDAVVIPDQLYWGANVQLTSQTAQDPAAPGQWIPGSTLLLSTALAWQATPKLFLGAEVRYFTTFDTATLNHPVRRALYVGPTVLWKFTDKIVFNATYQPQVYGRSTASPGLALDLDNFERAQFRLKLSVAF